MIYWPVIYPPRLAPQKLSNSSANTGLTFSLRKDFSHFLFVSFARDSVSLTFSQMQQRCVTCRSLCHAVTSSVTLCVTRRESLWCLFVTLWHAGQDEADHCGCYDCVAVTTTQQLQQTTSTILVSGIIWKYTNNWLNHALRSNIDVFTQTLKDFIQLCLCVVKDIICYMFSIGRNNFWYNIVY